MRQRALQHLASIWVAWSCGLTDPSIALGELPEDAVLESVEDVEDWNPEDLGALISLVRHDPRVRVRTRVAELSGGLSAVSTEASVPVLRALANDPSARVRAAASRGLARVIACASPARRVELVSEWASADEPRTRAAIARALGARTPMFITDLVIEQLAYDANVEVRCAALEAAGEHVAESRARYFEIAQAHASDADPRVRSVARRVLAHAS